MGRIKKKHRIQDRLETYRKRPSSCSGLTKADDDDDDDDDDDNIHVYCT